MVQADIAPIGFVKPMLVVQPAIKRFMGLSTTFVPATAFNNLKLDDKLFNHYWRVSRMLKSKKK